MHSWWNLQPPTRALPTRCNYTNTIHARSSALSPLHCAYNSTAPSRNWALSRPASAFCASCVSLWQYKLCSTSLSAFSQGDKLLNLIAHRLFPPVAGTSMAFVILVFILFLAPHTTNICTVILTHICLRIIPNLTYLYFKKV